jgi:23S rRNA pseudouridine1911/1915/1917 synthase
LDDETPPASHGPDALEPVHRLVVGTQGSGERLDKYLATQLSTVSRSRIQRWIADDAVRLNEAAPRSRAIVYAGDRIEVRERALPETTAFHAEPIAFPVVWEDASIIVVDKPAGLVVHPGAGNWSGTLLNGLLAYDPRLAAVPRAGIVHRLDAGTTGLMVVARTVAAQWDLVRQLAARTVVREYWALVAGEVAPSITITAAIDRDPRNPLRFRVSQGASARPARTYVRRLAQWNAAKPGAAPAPVSWIACRLDTGRTHQIRVHLESIGHPLIGDPVYRHHLPAALTTLSALTRPALHACRLELVHPQRHEPMAWSSAPPADMSTWMRQLGARPQQLRAPTRLSIVLASQASAHSLTPAPAEAADAPEFDKEP